MIDIKETIQEFIEGKYNDYPKKYSVYESLKNKENSELQYIYNEFSLQHELGNYLRYKLKEDYIVKFEYNIKDLTENSLSIDTCKKEIDILIINCETKEKYAIELKYLKNKAYPYRMYQCIKDMRFMNDVLKIKNVKETYCVVVTENKGFYESVDNENKDLINNKELLEAYYKYIKDLQRKRKNLENKEISKNEIQKIDNQLKMAYEITNYKEQFPCIYEYFRNSNKDWLRGKYIYSNLRNDLGIIDIHDFKENIKFDWMSIGDERSKYYVLKFTSTLHDQ